MKEIDAVQLERINLHTSCIIQYCSTEMRECDVEYIMDISHFMMRIVNAWKSMRLAPFCADSSECKLMKNGKDRCCAKYGKLWGEPLGTIDPPICVWDSDLEYECIGRSSVNIMWRVWFILHHILLFNQLYSSIIITLSINSICNKTSIKRQLL